MPLKTFQNNHIKHKNTSQSLSLNPHRPGHIEFHLFFVVLRCDNPSRDKNERAKERTQEEAINTRANCHSYESLRYNLERRKLHVSTMSQLLTSRQAEELHKSLIAYLTSANLPNSAAALREELQIGETFDAATSKKYEGLLEKKWTSVVRLQKRVCHPFTKNAAVLTSCS